MNEDELNKITEAVIVKIKEKYLLIEKTFNLDDRESELQKAKTNTFIDNVTNITCQYFEVDKNKLMMQEKIKHEFHKTTWCIGYLCRELPETAIPQAKIGSFFKKHHSTIHHWQHMAESKMEKDIEFKYEVNEVKKLVEQSLKL